MAYLVWVKPGTYHFDGHYIVNNPYRHDMNELNIVGHTFYLTANLPYHLNTKLTLGDKENPVYTWNYFLEKEKEESLQLGSERIWKIGTSVPRVTLDKTIMDGSEPITGWSEIKDQYGNKLVYTFIDKDSSWSSYCLQGSRFIQQRHAKNTASSRHDFGMYGSSAFVARAVPNDRSERLQIKGWF